MIATHVTVRSLTRRAEKVVHKLYMDSFLDISMKECQRALTIRQNWNGVTWAGVRGNLTAVVWNGKQDVYMHRPPTEGNFCDEQGKAQKPVIVTAYSHHLGYIDRGDRMVDSYSIGQRTWKWMKKLFFHLLDLSVLNIIILSFCVVKLTTENIILFLVWNLLKMNSRELQSLSTLWWNQTHRNSQMMWCVE